MTFDGFFLHQTSKVIILGLTQAELVEAGFDKLSLRKSCIYSGEWRVISTLSTRRPSMSITSML